MINYFHNYDFTITYYINVSIWGKEAKFLAEVSTKKGGGVESNIYNFSVKNFSNIRFELKRKNKYENIVGVCCRLV